MALADISPVAAVKKAQAGAARLCYWAAKRRGYILQSRPLSQDWERAWGMG